MSVLTKIAQYFTNWSGEDENKTNIDFSTEDLRFIVNLNVENCRLRDSERIVKYFEQTHPEEYNNIVRQLRSR